ncbi:MAG: prolipoprotein diacylglyceryl transferase [Chloroflexota bacterium]|nr:prolipoprotein diacylglyceryl transferase [Chloroflexota bacterium]
MNPVVFSIGPITIHWYGLLIVAGAILAAYIGTLEAKRRGEDPEHVWNMLIWILIFGIIGARLYHVFSTPVDGLGWDYYKENPIAIINFWNGGFRGLGIFGGLLGGIIAVFIYCWKNKLNMWRWLDIFAPGLLLAQALGRFGNWINQELYGPPTDLPWGFKINTDYPYQPPPTTIPRPPGMTEDAFIANTRFHPTFFYEALWNLVGFALLMWIGRRFQSRLRDGDIFLLYLIWYPLGRIIVEMFRPDAWITGVPGLATAQLISLGIIVASIITLIIRHRNWQPEPPLGTVEEVSELP